MSAAPSTKPVYVSSTSFEAGDLRTILALCEEGRLDALELSALDGGELTLLGSTQYPSRLLVHNYFPLVDPPFVLNLASRDPATLERSRAHCRAAIDLSHELGGGVYAAHAGYTADLGPEVLGHPDRQAALPADRFASRDDAYTTLVESARELAAYGSERGVRFLIENHVLAAEAGDSGSKLLLIVEPSEMAQLVGDVDEDGFGLLVDVGHLKVSAATVGFDAVSALTSLAPWIGALHLSENDGIADAHAPFGDDAWFLPKLRELADATVTVELARQPVDSIADVRATVARWL